jgi:hypothetical protein
MAGIVYKEETLSVTREIKPGVLLVDFKANGVINFIYGELSAELYPNGQTRISQLGGIKKQYAPNDDMNLYDIDTGVFKRTAKEKQFMESLKSLYVSMAALRDINDLRVKPVPYPMVGRIE